MDKKLSHLVAALLLGAIPAAYAQQPPTEPGDPGTASSPHQREATGQSTPEAPATPSPEPSAAASPHQEEALSKDGSSKTNGKKMRMAADMTGADPATFVKKAGQGGMTEVEVSKLALSKGQDAKVRSFAQQMVKDHSAANQELMSLAKSKGWTVPASLDSEHKAIVQKLSSKSGADFDAAYSQQMMEDHEKTVALFQGAAKSSDQDLASWAKKTLPTLEEHLHMADALPATSHSASAEPKAQRQY